MRWDSIVGAQLEELLYGLLEALGAKELVWRAGSNHGVTASDGGRDLEAVFIQSTPDGEEDRTRWWLESKGRGQTVPKDEVISSINNLTDRNDLDVFVFCTNSRFSNPTRDWVENWQKLNPRPRIRLWDRDRLDLLVRKHPTVLARVLPEALDDGERLKLLLDRFLGLGETPTDLDMAYFWERPSIVTDSPDVAYLVAMFAYAETADSLVERPWGSFLADSDEVVITTIMVALFELPIRGFVELARPLHQEHLIITCAYLILSVMPYCSAENLHGAMSMPGTYIAADDHFLKDPAKAASWTEAVVKPILGRIQDELTDVCTDDCVRVMTDARAFPPPMLGERYWRRFGIGDVKKNPIFTFQEPDKPCVVGLPLDRNHGCPLISGFELSLNRIAEIRQIVEFRRAHPKSDQRWTLEGETRPDFKLPLKGFDSID
ncbi:hypothetical protein RQCS_62050 (plasmid) [Rhodococcus qingshengii]|nr:hypothetical protein RQCS_62050 [Rhodococcus qingshengii]